MQPTRLCLVRHGQTDWNAERRVQGQLDVGLNATGEAQARAVRPGLAGHGFAAAYSSDLARAWRTAQIATDGLDCALAAEPALRERNYGVYQGLTAAEAELRVPLAFHHHQRRTPDYAYETGETLAEFAARVTAGLETLARRHPGTSVLAFTHGGVLDIVYRVACGRDLSSPRDFVLPNAAVNWIEIHADRWQLLAWADLSHLEQGQVEVVGEV